MKKYSRTLFIIAGILFVLGAAFTFISQTKGSILIGVLFLVAAGFQFLAAYFQKK